MTIVRKAQCFHCRLDFDPVRSKWCDCMQSTRSLVCPDCGLCSCAAPVAWKVNHAPNMRRPLRDSAGANERPAAIPAESDAAAVPRTRVLVVDDDRFVQMLAREGLSKEFDVTVAKDGLSGLAQARELHPDVVITDALMPGLDGRELCRMLKSDRETEDIRVIIMTSVYRNSRHESEAIKRFGADGFLRKPVSISQLSGVIASAAASRGAAVASAWEQPGSAA